MNRVPATLLLVLLLAVMGGAFVRLAVRDAQGGESHPVYTSQRYDPWGSAALAGVLHARGIDARRLERPRLPPDFRGVLLQVAPAVVSEFPSADTDEPVEPQPGNLATAPLLDWVAKGNTLVHLTRRPTALTAALELTGPADTLTHDPVAQHQRTGGTPRDVPGAVVVADWVGDGAGNRGGNRGGNGATNKSDAPTRRLMLRSPLTLDYLGNLDDPNGDPSDDRWSARIHDGDRTLGGVYRHGAGRVVVLGAPTPALNHPLGQYDHLPWLLEQLGDGPVLFDGWSHGIGHAGGILETLARFGLVPLLIQGVLLLLGWRWATRRAPAADPPPPPTPRNAREQIETLARLGRATLPAAETARRTYDVVRARLAHGLRCRPEDVPDRLRARRGPTAERATRLLARAAALAAADRPRCTACGHDLAGRRGDRCAECGATLSPSQLRHSRRPELTSPPPEPEAGAGAPEKRSSSAELLDASAALVPELRLD